MNSETTSTLVKILIMILTPIATKYHLDGNLVPAFAADAADIMVLAFSFWRNRGQKLVPTNSVAIQIAPGEKIPDVGTHLIQSSAVSSGAVKVVGSLAMLILCGGMLGGCQTLNDLNNDIAVAKKDIGLAAAAVVKNCPPALAGTIAVANALDPTTDTGKTAANVATATQATCSAASALVAANK